MRRLLPALSYHSPFLLLCRELLVGEWLRFLRDRGVPMSPGIADPLKVLVDDAAVAGWVREGLPADPTSVQNGAILTNSGGWGRALRGAYAGGDGMQV